MDEHDAAVAGTERAFGEDEVALGEAAGLGVDDAGDLHPVHHGDHKRHDPERGLEERGEHDGEQQRGKAIIRSVKRMRRLPTGPRR